MRVYVILFNARTDNEGIHSLRAGDRDVVLMFESEDDATRYALLLEAQDLPPATVEEFEAEEIEEFCASVGYDVEFIEEGTLAVPPEANLDETDWQPEGQKEAQPESDFSDTELDSIRRRLEGLL